MIHVADSFRMVDLAGPYTFFDLGGVEGSHIHSCNREPCQEHILRIHSVLKMAHFAALSCARSTSRVRKAEAAGVALSKRGCTRRQKNQAG